MCNLSTGIEERATERATEKTSEKFILNMYKKGYTLDQIADEMCIRDRQNDSLSLTGWSASCRINGRQL